MVKPLVVGFSRNRKKFDMWVQNSPQFLWGIRLGYQSQQQADLTACCCDSVKVPKLDDTLW
jgi:hypothetical protein